MASSPWDSHYDRERSRLSFPDENLLRLLNKIPRPLPDSIVLDLGCGSGRHLSLLRDSGYGSVIGTDLSHQALKISASYSPDLLIQCANSSIPLKNGCVNLLIAWGSLHYTDKSGISAMLREIHRVLIPGGILLGTLRSSRDTYLKSGRHIGDNVWITDLADLQGATVSFYDEDELRRLFDCFRGSIFGFTERSIIGRTDKVISHWIIMATK